ncbi:MAG: hypothetical protein ACPLYF_00430 [Fervidobacterium sp.]
MPELEIYIVTILAVSFTLAYAFGSRYNYKIQKKIWKTLSKEMKPYSKEAAFQSLGSSGFKIACKPQTDQLSKLEVSIVLLSREIPFYYLISKYRGKCDNIVIKSNFKTAPGFTLEIVKKGTKFHREIVKNSKFIQLQNEKLSEFFFLASSNPDQASEFFSKRSIVQNITKLGSKIERLSITSEEPHLLLICDLEENIIGQLLSLTSVCGKSLEPT